MSVFFFSPLGVHEAHGKTVLLQTVIKVLAFLGHAN